MKFNKTGFGNGFTLVEVIVTSVVLAFVAGMMASYFGTAITQSSIPIARLNTAASLNQVLEKITGQYSRISHWHPNTPYVSGTVILPSAPNSNGFKYICTAGGTSGAYEPPWPIASGASITYGGVTWQHNGSAPTLIELQTAIGVAGGGEDQNYSNAFGNYRVIQNRFIKFDAAGAEVNINGTTSDPVYGRFLKVAIALRSDAPNRTAEMRTTLFVRR